MNLKQEQNYSHIDEQDIDFSEKLNSIIRQKKYLIGISTISIFLGVIYLFSEKPTWEGHFQIVIKDQSLSKGNSSLEQLSSVLNQSDFSELKTELKILESPSILKPVYDFVKEKKYKDKGEKYGLDFYTWKDKNLDISLEKGTSVLNLEYRDKDKSNILPVLNKISKAYQKYSGSERNRNITQGLTFLEKEIKRMNIQSKESFLKLQKFSLENGLGNRDGLPLALNESSLSSKSFPIRNLDASVAQLVSQKIENKSTNINPDPQLRYEIKYEKLSRLESELLEKSILLKPNTKYIINLKNEIKALRKSISRSPEILVEYRKLKYNARRDENLLESLQNNLSSFKLENAKQSNPWDLISQPTLIDDPIWPIKETVIGISILLGVFVGSVVSIIVDNKTGKIYSLENLKKIINYPLLKTLSISSENFKNSINLLATNLKQNKNSLISIIPVGSSFRKDHTKVISNSLKKELGNSEIIISNQINNSSKLSNQILIFSPGSCTINELNQILEDLKIQNGFVAGWIFISD